MSKKQPKVFVGKETRVAKTLAGAQNSFERSVRHCCEEGVSTDEKEKAEIDAAWKRLVTLAKAGLHAFEADGRRLLDAVTG